MSYKLTAQLGITDLHRYLVVELLTAANAGLSTLTVFQNCLHVFSASLMHGLTLWRHKLIWESVTGGSVQFAVTYRTPANVCCSKYMQLYTSKGSLGRSLNSAKKAECFVRLVAFTQAG